MTDLTEHIGSRPWGRRGNPAELMDELRSAKRRAAKTLADSIFTEIPEDQWAQAIKLISEEHRSWALRYLSEKKSQCRTSDL